jgi:hypothetical protein
MIYYLSQDEIDKSKWDNCIRSGYNGLIYSYSWYLDIVAEQWDALINDDYSQVFPLVYNVKAGIKYLYLPPFTQQLGLFSKKTIEQQDLKLFLKAIPTSFKYGEINLNTENNAIACHYKIKNNITHHLQINDDIEITRKNYSENIKRNIKKAIKNKISISNNISPESVITLFKDNKALHIPNLKDENYNVLRNIIHKCIYSGKANCWGAFTEENQLCAGAFFLKSNNKAVFLFSGLNNKGRETGAMALLIDKYIESITGEIKTFDFEGSNNFNLARFYKSFGSQEVVYQQININNLPKLFRPFIKFYKYLK